MAHDMGLLLEAIVGSHHRLYNESPTFHRDVNALVDAIPLMVDFAADRAQKHDALRDEAMNRLAKGLDLPVELLRTNVTDRWTEGRG